MKTRKQTLIIISTMLILMLASIVSSFVLTYEVSNNEINISIENGTAPYQVFDNNAQIIINTTNESQISMILDIGCYNLTISDNTTTNETINFCIEPEPILGCTDPQAINYNENATENDDSCIYPLIINHTKTNATYYENNTLIIRENGSIFINVTGGTQPYKLYDNTNQLIKEFQNTTTEDNLTPGLYNWIINDSGNQTQQIIFEIYEEKTIVGCIYSNAINYNENATKQGHCDYYETWIQENTLPGDYDEGANMILLTESNNKLFMMGGRTIKPSNENNNWIYDLETRIWSKGANMLENAEGIGITHYENKIYVGPSFGSKNLQIYDIENDSWSYGAEAPHDLFDYGMVAINGKIYVLGGASSQLGYNTLNKTYIYDIENNSWSQGAEIPFSREGFYGVAGAIVGENKQIYLAGGVNYNEGDYTPERTLLIYNVENDSWSQGPNMPKGLAYHGVTGTEKHIFAIGGWDEEWEVINYVFKYDIQEDSWVINSALPYPLSEVGVTTVNQTIYLAGGHFTDTSKRSNILYKYIMNEEEKEEKMCVTDWECTAWSACEGSLKTRTCKKIESQCEAGPRPTETEQCETTTRTPSSGGAVQTVSRIQERIQETPKQEKTQEENITNKTTIKPILFDIYLDPVKNRIKEGEHLDLIIGLINVGVPGRVYATTQYKIINKDNIVVHEETNTVYVETQTEFIKKIDTSNLEIGTYSVFVELKYEGQTEPAQAQTNIIIEEKQQKLFEKYLEINTTKIQTIKTSLLTIIVIITSLVLLQFHGIINLPQKQQGKNKNNKTK
jgi:hypothetical protein